MQITPLRGMVGKYGRLQRNRPAIVDKETAEQLIKKGLAVPTPKAGAKDVPGKSSTKSRTGGRTGKAKPSSSSPADPAPESKT